MPDTATATDADFNAKEVSGAEYWTERKRSSAVASPFRLKLNLAKPVRLKADRDATTGWDMTMIESGEYPVRRVAATKWHITVSLSTLDEEGCPLILHYLELLDDRTRHRICSTLRNQSSETLVL